MESKFFQINWRDVWHGAIVAAGSAAAASFGQFLDAWTQSPILLAFNKVSFILSLKVALAAGISYLTKKIFEGDKNEKF